MNRTLAVLALLSAVACSALSSGHPNVLLLEGSDNFGSGVVIVDGWILTARHILPIETANGMPCGEAIAHPWLDVALIPCEGAKAYGLEPAHELPGVYDRVYTYSWPLGEVLLKTEGFQGVAPGWMSAPVIYGSSGGAVVNDRGELVGIITLVGYMDVDEGEGTYGVPYVAGYTVVDEAMRGWIGNNIR